MGGIVSMTQGCYQGNIGISGPNSMSSGTGSLVSSASAMSGITNTGGGMMSGGGGALGGSISGSMYPTSGGLQGPLAYLEKTTTNIGLPDTRR